MQNNSEVNVNVRQRRLTERNRQEKKKMNWHRIALYLECFEKTSAILIVATWDDEKRCVHRETTEVVSEAGREGDKSTAKFRMNMKVVCIFPPLFLYKITYIHQTESEVFIEMESHETNIAQPSNSTSYLRLTLSPTSLTHCRFWKDVEDSRKKNVKSKQQQTRPSVSV